MTYAGCNMTNEISNPMKNTQPQSTNMNASTVAPIEKGKAPFPRSLLRSVLHAISSAAQLYMAWSVRRATLRMLAQLDERTLHDIGMSRSEIHSIVYSEADDRLRRYDSMWG